MEKNAVLGADALSSICYQLGLLQKAGIGSEEGVSLLAEDAPDRTAGEVLTALHGHLSEGLPLSAALEKQGSFPDYMVRMVEIGQASGRLDQVLSALSTYYRRQSETNSAIRRAILYPAVMAVLVCAVFLILIIRVLPVFQQVFTQLGVSLSPLAQGLLRSGEAGKYIAGGFVVLLAVGAVALLFVSRRRSKAAQSLETRFLGRGATGRAVERSHFANAMALMLQSGLPLDEAMERTAKLLAGSSLESPIEACRKRMEEGVDFSAAVSGCGLLDKMQCGLLSAGFRAGSSDKVMEELAVRCQEEADERLSRLLSRMEFILVAVLCLAVGLVLLSVMLPLLGVLSAIG